MVNRIKKYFMNHLYTCYMFTCLCLTLLPLTSGLCSTTGALSGSLGAVLTAGPVVGGRVLVTYL